MQVRVYRDHNVGIGVEVFMLFVGLDTDW